MRQGLISALTGALMLVALAVAAYGADCDLRSGCAGPYVRVTCADCPPKADYCEACYPPDGCYARVADGFTWGTRGDLRPAKPGESEPPSAQVGFVNVLTKHWVAVPMLPVAEFAPMCEVEDSAQPPYFCCGLARDGICNWVMTGECPKEREIGR